MQEVLSGRSQLMAAYGTTDWQDQQEQESKGCTNRTQGAQCCRLLEETHTNSKAQCYILSLMVCALAQSQLVIAQKTCWQCTSTLWQGCPLLLVLSWQAGSETSSCCKSFCAHS